MKIKQIRIILIIMTIILYILFLTFIFQYLENKIYINNYKSTPGDCGQFVIWEYLSRYDKDIDLRKISLETNPFSLFTGPLTIKEYLNKNNISTTFYNNFSLIQAKEKLDEGKPVILMINLNSTGFADMGLSHYLFVFDYEDNNTLKGFYFTDSYYFDWNWSEPVYWDVEKLEYHRQNVMQPMQLLGKIENLAGMEKFAIVINEAEKENINKRTKIIFYIQYAAEKIILTLGKIIMFFSKKV